MGTIQVRRYAAPGISGAMRRRWRRGVRRVAAAWRMLAVWYDRTQQRRALSQLDDRLLRDIGLTYEDAHKEANKPFWHP